MFKLKASVFGLIFSLALLQNVFAAETAPAPPVILTHTLTSSSTEGDTISLNFTIHVVNQGDRAFSDMTLNFVPLPPFGPEGCTLYVGDLGPYQSGDFSVMVVTPARLSADKFSQRPLFWTGKCLDAQGRLVEFPATSRPAGATVSVTGGLKEQTTLAGGNPVAPVTAAAAAPDSQPAPGDFLFKWGDSTIFNSPYGVAVDPSGNVYVCDTGNHRIQKFDSRGNFIMTWGSYGSGNGQFEYPSGVALDANGNIYVADSGNNRVQIFDNTGIFLRNIEGSIGVNDQLTGPTSVAVDANGNVYVDDWGEDTFGRMLVFDNTGTFVRFEGEGVTPIYGDRGIAVDANGNVYAADGIDRDDRVLVFDNTGTLVRSIQNFNSGLWEEISGVAVDASGNLYVADDAYGWPFGRVQVFDNTGNFKATFGSYGTGDGQFLLAEGVATNASGTIVYVTDIDNNNVQAFVGYGTPSFTVSFVPGAHGSISGTASQTVTSGGNTTAVTAVPDSGYRFMNWTGDNGFVATTDNPLTLTNVTANHTITANFAANAPMTTTATVNGTAGTNSWYVSDVGISFSALEAKKICTKLDNRAMTATAGSAATLSITSGGSHTVIYYAVDGAGNEESPHTLNINIDKTPPVIRIAGVTNGAVFALGRTVPAMRYTVTDRFSGMASQDAALTGGNANNAGIFTYTVNATDNAGNTATKAVTYSVRYLFRGLLPVSGKKFAAGSAVPVTFQLRDAKGNYISTASATLWLKSPTGAPITPASSTNTGNAFQYDPVTNRYIYNLNTVGLVTGRWQLQVLLDDGSPVKTTYIKLN